MISQDIMMVIVDTTQHVYDPGIWVKVQAEIIPQIYELVRKNYELYLIVGREIIISNW